MQRMPSIMMSVSLMTLFCAPAGAQVGPVLRVVSGASSDGRASEQWLATLRKRLSDSAYQAVAGLRRPYSEPEERWAALIRCRSIAWEAEISGLAAAYAPAEPPKSAVIVLGNRGGEDAFVHDPTTIGFDLSALDGNYGGAELRENGERIDRFFRHEYVHLMQKVWLRQHPAAGATPLELALADIWSEGLGNFYSLSGRWRGADGSLTEHARRALAALEPRFVAKLAALACADPRDAAILSPDLSAGPFAEKWDALPAALWLAMEEADSAGALRRFVAEGPEGVWTLAERRMAQALRPVLREIRAAAARCERQR